MMLALILLGSVVAGTVLGIAGMYWRLIHTPDFAEGLGPLF
jgi:hypothetical protein